MGNGTVSDDDKAERTALEFQLAYWNDVANQSVKPLSAYRASFPRAEHVIAEEFERVTRREATPRLDHTARAVRSTLGAFRLVREIGRGSQAVVWLARDEALGRDVAIKIYEKHDAADVVAAARFRREAVLASGIDHPGLCPVYEVGEDDDRRWIVMRFIDGESLADRLRRSSAAPIARDEAIGVVAATARALHAAHESGIVHRDVKPANVMLTPSAPVVLDFGVAHALEQSELRVTCDGPAPGTPMYMAPEQLDASLGACDRRSDVWALGAIFFECLSGGVPFRASAPPAPPGDAGGASVPALRRRLRAVGGDAITVLATALSTDPAHRYQTAAELADDLERLRADQPIRATRPGRARFAWRWARRHPLPAASIATVVVGVVVVIALALVVERQRAATRSILNRLERIEDEHTLSLMSVWAEELLPPTPDLVDGPRGMTAWLATARRLENRAAEDARWLDDGAQPRPDDGVGDERDAWIRESLQGVVARAKALEPAIADMEARRAWALAVDDATIHSRFAEWRSTIDAIADTKANPAYRGLRITPQRGLVPMGKDPRSGFFEFAHLQSGAIPRRDPSDGRIHPTAACGMVFVLMPGGEYQVTDRGGLTAIHLEPFFLSKFEISRSQWKRTMPADLRVDRTGPGMRGTTFDDVAPADGLSLDSIAVATRRLGLRLPTEDEWEAACRAGTTTDWFSGPDASSLAGFANVADQSLGRASPSHVNVSDEVDDGYIEYSPIGAFAPNAFGFHDMIGNVREPVRERAAASRPRDWPVEDLHAACGGSWGDPASAARASTRHQLSARTPDGFLGLRPARDVVRETQ